jgi:Putative adhesin
MKIFALGLAALVTGAVLSAAEAYGSFDRSLTVSGPVDLEVQTDSGGITVTAGSSGVVRIHAILKAQQGWLSSNGVDARIRELERNPPIEQNGNRVRVGYLHEHNLLRNISMRLEIEAPAATELRARADSGGIEVRGLEGRIDCKTDSGGLKIHDAGSEVHAQADSGGVHINNAKGAVFAHVDSGGIDALDVAGALDLQSDSGQITLSQTVAAPIRVKADSGRVRVRLVPGAGYDVNAESDSGNISIPEMTVSSGFSRHHIEGKIRGGGSLVSIHVGSGGITIE